MPEIKHILRQGLFKLIQTTALKMAVFVNGGVLARLKIRHIQGFTVLPNQRVWVGGVGKMIMLNPIWCQVGWWSPHLHGNQCHCLRIKNTWVETEWQFLLRPYLSVKFFFSRYENWIFFLKVNFKTCGQKFLAKFVNICPHKFFQGFLFWKISF